MIRPKDADAGHAVRLTSKLGQFSYRNLCMCCMAHGCNTGWLPGRAMCFEGPVVCPSTMHMQGPTLQSTLGSVCQLFTLPQTLFIVCNPTSLCLISSQSGC